MKIIDERETNANTKKNKDRTEQGRGEGRTYSERVSAK